MNFLVVILLVITVIMITLRFRNQRDHQLLTDEVKKRGGELVRLQRVKKGSPFSDTTRGWWAWRVTWRDGSGERSSWALTTREGLGEWRD